METKGKLDLATARRMTPPLSASIADGLRMAAIEAITEDDVGQIVRMQVEKAKNGDTAASKFVLEFLGKQSAATQPRIVQPSRKSEAEDSANTRRIVKQLAEKGPLRPRSIAEDLGLADSVVIRLIAASNLFDQQRLGVHLSAEGWATVKERAEDDGE